MRPLASVLIVLAVSACGSGSGSGGSSGAREREWADGAAQIVVGLEDALGRVANAGVGRVTLENTSALYEALLGYTYLGSCSRLLEQLGEPVARQVELRDLLRRACARLVHASNVFTQAVQRKKAALLTDAAREALGAAPLLRRARELLGPAS